MNFIDGKEQQICEKCNKFFIKGVRPRRFCLPCAAKRRYTPVKNEKKKCTICSESYVPKNKTQNFCSEECKEKYKIQKINVSWTKDKKPVKRNKEWGNFNMRSI
jgi:predicted nucleic acid-binding Zn ribbon protein